MVSNDYLVDKFEKEFKNFIDRGNPRNGSFFELNEKLSFERCHNDRIVRRHRKITRTHYQIPVDSRHTPRTKPATIATPSLDQGKTIIDVEEINKQISQLRSQHQCLLLENDEGMEKCKVVDGNRTWDQNLSKSKRVEVNCRKEPFWRSDSEEKPVKEHRQETPERRLEPPQPSSHRNTRNRTKARYHKHCIGNGDFEPSTQSIATQITQSDLRISQRKNSPALHKKTEVKGTPKVAKAHPRSEHKNEAKASLPREVSPRQLGDGQRKKTPTFSKQDHSPRRCVNQKSKLSDRHMGDYKLDHSSVPIPTNSGERHKVCSSLYAFINNQNRASPCMCGNETTKTKKTFHSPKLDTPAKHQRKSQSLRKEKFSNGKCYEKASDLVTISSKKVVSELMEISSDLDTMRISEYIAKRPQQQLYVPINSEAEALKIDDSPIKYVDLELNLDTFRREESLDSVSVISIDHESKEQPSISINSIGRSKDHKNRKCLKEFLEGQRLANVHRQIKSILDQKSASRSLLQSEENLRNTRSSKNCQELSDEAEVLKKLLREVKIILDREYSMQESDRKEGNPSEEYREHFAISKEVDNFQTAADLNSKRQSEISENVPTAKKGISFREKNHSEMLESTAIIKHNECPKDLGNLQTANSERIAATAKESLQNLNRRPKTEHKMPVDECENTNSEEYRTEEYNIQPESTIQVKQEEVTLKDVNQQGFVVIEIGDNADIPKIEACLSDSNDPNNDDMPLKSGQIKLGKKLDYAQTKMNLVSETPRNIEVKIDRDADKMELDNNTPRSSRRVKMENKIDYFQDEKESALQTPCSTRRVKMENNVDSLQKAKEPVFQTLCSTRRAKMENNVNCFQDKMELANETLRSSRPIKLEQSESKTELAAKTPRSNQRVKMEKNGDSFQEAKEEVPQTPCSTRRDKMENNVDSLQKAKEPVFQTLCSTRRAKMENNVNCFQDKMELANETLRSSRPIKLEQSESKTELAAKTPRSNQRVKMEKNGDSFQEAKEEVPQTPCSTRRDKMDNNVNSFQDKIELANRTPRGSRPIKLEQSEAKMELGAKTPRSSQGVKMEKNGDSLQGEMVLAKTYCSSQGVKMESNVDSLHGKMKLANNNPHSSRSIKPEKSVKMETNDDIEAMKQSTKLYATQAFEHQIEENSARGNLKALPEICKKTLLEAINDRLRGSETTIKADNQTSGRDEVEHGDSCGCNQKTKQKVLRILDENKEIKEKSIESCKSSSARSTCKESECCDECCRECCNQTYQSKCCDETSYSKNLTSLNEIPKFNGCSCMLGHYLKLISYLNSDSDS